MYIMTWLLVIWTKDSPDPQYGLFSAHRRDEQTFSVLFLFFSGRTHFLFRFYVSSVPDFFKSVLFGAIIAAWQAEC